MAEDLENDDQWLYGDNSEQEPQVPGVEEPAPIEDPPNDTEPVTEPPQVEEPPPSPPQELEEAKDHDKETNNTQPPDEPNENVSEPQNNTNGEGSDEKEDYDEDSDDDVNVVIGDFKTTPSYSALNIKRGGALLTSTTKGTEKHQLQTGKYTVEEFEQAGLINGIPVSDFNVDCLEDKPWRKPGADITDYFNYGFNEDTWRAYCERQKRMRVNESGTGLLPLNSIGMPRATSISIMNDNSKYAANCVGLRKAGPPPARGMTGTIDVIGGNTAATLLGVPIPKVNQPKENVIQVMIADRREYSRKPPTFPDTSVPPPTFEEFVPEVNFNPEPEPFYGGYEPTQDVQWGTEPNPAWQPQEIKTLTPSSPISNPRVPMPSSPVNDRSPPRRSRSKERESSRRDIERVRDRDRERSHRRDRSRSRSKRHKSRSRSQSRSRHRSHRKKKSRRHEDSD